uniref:Neutral ceramidase n=1 Tax=Macrostomum lignano TaxID=282301 RepID=A0A1I8JPI4_9PLAT
MLLLSVATVLVVLTSSTAVQAQGLEAGVGYADITGPAGEVPMLHPMLFRWATPKPRKKTAGIHMRLFARAFAFRDAEGRSAAFVNVDAGMISPMMKLKVIEILKSKLGSTYTEANVLLSATHTHSGPGVYHGYTLYAISTLGYFADTFNTLANGNCPGIELAHASLRPTKLQFNSGQLANSGVNRSPTSYLLNPESERARYEHNTDRDMTVVKLVDANSGKPFGMLNWFAVHPTSMNNTNLLIKRRQQRLGCPVRCTQLQAFERFMDYQAGTNTLPGGQRFVASFANANEGDVSPNTDGPRCMDTGEPCDIATSTCGGKAKHCVASGPGKDMLDSTRIIGLKQFGRAMYVDMSNQQLTVNGRRVRTCPPAMGFSFAAGTTDGPGGFDFTQGDTSGNPFWNLVRGILSKPNQEQINCHSPKPILLNTGYMTFPTDWQPKVIETQLLKIGPLVIVALPGEFTTMSGRRVREAVQKALADNGMTGAKVVLSGVSNLYSSYVTTFEEYQVSGDKVDVNN